MNIVLSTWLLQSSFDISFVSYSMFRVGIFNLNNNNNNVSGNHRKCFYYLIFGILQLYTSINYAGRVIISGAEDGLLAISSPSTGLTVRLLNDHKGAPITCLHVSSVKVNVAFLSFFFYIKRYYRTKWLQS